ncbi:MAG: YopX family protein [Staphylococcus equorum]|uniref:YopX family protein n=1 Tax=Staphylococcus TaxID=1279 RepID=UPI0025542AFA|nr:YopX family protein [Staphylococcus equorum]MDK9870657.1 YopX family protein [Staphylococcus equorum]MDK9876055.1 YopX family protein [Staphylococcus equorum]MDN6612702.1 YopX family protein [Staphylococcus equorum]MDN6741263.1 YopX family protein [Staphylococcus equorum]MDN6750873.1 YopX family protein [Staphylococcus equorum]
MVPKFRVYETDRKAMHYTDKDLVVCFSDNGVDVIDHTTFSSSCMDIDNFVLMQSTGLKDKNGEDIFEGDVVKTKYGEHGRHIGVVKYGGAKFYSEGVKQYLSWHEDLNGLFEIIGNQFEQPHLLEGDNE